MVGIRPGKQCWPKRGRQVCGQDKKVALIGAGTNMSSSLARARPKCWRTDCAWGCVLLLPGRPSTLLVDPQEHHCGTARVGIRCGLAFAAGIAFRMRARNASAYSKDGRCTKGTAPRTKMQIGRSFKNSSHAHHQIAARCWTAMWAESFAWDDPLRSHCFGVECRKAPSLRTRAMASSIKRTQHRGVNGGTWRRPHPSPPPLRETRQSPALRNPRQGGSALRNPPKPSPPETGGPRPWSTLR